MSLAFPRPPAPSIPDYAGRASKDMVNLWAEFFCWFYLPPAQNGVPYGVSGEGPPSNRVNTQQGYSIVNIIDRSRATQIIENSGGKILSVTFRKRSDGTVRHLTGRLGVTIGVNGQGKPFNAQARGLITIYELLNLPGQRNGKRAGQWRHIPIEGIRSVKANGEEYAIV